MSGPDSLVERLNEVEALLASDYAYKQADAIREAAAELSTLRSRCETQREHTREQAEDIMALGKLVYASETETWQARAEALQERLDLELDAYAKDHDMAALRASRDAAVAALEKIANWSTVSGMHEQDRDKRLREIARAALTQDAGKEKADG